MIDTSKNCTASSTALQSEFVNVPANSGLELYNQTSFILSRQLTIQFSSSFSSSSRLFNSSIRSSIYAIYGLVRIADEIVDSYHGTNAAELLDELYSDVQRALRCGYSANPIVQSYVLTAREFLIDSQLLAAFFASMRLDLQPQSYSDELYEKYIYGSAEVIGLMCLTVFVGGNKTQYAQLESGARALGSAYQKVNFLRDMKADFEQLGRVYFPDVDYEKFDDTTKLKIISNIENEFDNAKTVIKRLPRSSRRAVRTSYDYYSALLGQLKLASVEDIKQRRISVPKLKKIKLLLNSYLQIDLGK